MIRSAPIFAIGLVLVLIYAAGDWLGWWGK